MEGIPKGLIFPLAFGIKILLMGLGENFLLRSSKLKERIKARVTFSPGISLTLLAFFFLRKE